MPTLEANLPYIGVLDVTNYVAGAIIFISLIALFKLIQVVILGRLHALSKKTSTDIDDVIIEAIKVSVRGYIHWWHYLCHYNYSPCLMP